MTATDPEAGQPPAPAPDDDVAPAAQVLDLARQVATGQRAGYLAAGVPVSLTNGTGDTLPVLAAYRDHPETVAAPLRRDADTERADGRGRPALGAAVSRRSEAGVRPLLLSAGADPAAGSPSGLEVARSPELPDMQRLHAADRGA